MWKVLKGVLGGSPQPPPDFAVFREALDTKDLPRAKELLEAYETYEAPTPDDRARHTLELARSWGSLGDSGRVRRELEKGAAAKEAPSAALQREVRTELYRVLVDQGDPTAGPLAEELLATAPDTSSIEHARAVVVVADTVLAARPERVIELSQEAMPILLASVHSDLADLVVLRALARSFLKAEPPLLGEEVQRIDEAVFGRLAHAAMARAARVDPPSAVAVLEEIRDQIIGRNAHDPVLIRLTESLARVAQSAQNHEVALDAWDWLVVTHDNRGRERDAHTALLELASVLCDAERWEDAGARYKEAVFRAQGLGPAAACRANREAGLFEAALGDMATAEHYLQKAIDHAPDAVLKAEAQVALGALLAELSPARAKPLLEQGVSALPADHPDAEFAREQLRTMG